MSERDPLQQITRDLTTGTLSRRGFIRRAVALGVSASAIGAILAACGAETAPTVPAASTAPSTAPSAAPTTAATRAATASAAPGASTATRAAATATRAGTAAAGGNVAGVPLASPPASPGKRGGGGTLKLLYWQAPTVLNTHLAQGTKDQDASRVVYEPLATIDGDGKFIPILAAEIPSQANGGLSADQKVVTWKLKPGVKWSDGTPFTAKDVVFTYQYVIDEKTGATTTGDYKSIDKVEAVDDTTVRITFKEAQAGWYIPFVGGYRGTILPQHIFSAGKGEAAKNFPANLQPVGTGPYRVVQGGFKPGDSVTYEINPNYRDANAPFFDRVDWKGGGDATSAARAVIQTGDYDYGWNLQVEAAVLNQLQQTGARGEVFTIISPNCERLIINFSDPNKEVDGQRSEKNTPHPFLTDKAVRQAMALACDKKTIVDVGYGAGGAIADNILYTPAQFNSPNNKSEFNLDKANQVLDQAGWAKSGQYRAKNGVQMSLVYYTTVNTVRQKTQQIVKDAWEKIGIKTELKSADAAVFFSSDLGNTDTAAKCYVDVEMFTNGNSTPEPFAYMEDLTTDKIAQKSNQWAFGNYGRWSNKDYDATIDQLEKELDPQKRAQLFIKANDIMVQDYAQIPLVYRQSVSCKAKTLQIGPSTAWDCESWNIANWVKR
jgi:peptide/nickel transport system substrate-binding protein